MPADPTAAGARSVGVDVVWLTAFLDVSPIVEASTTAFWSSVTGFEPNDPSGDDGQYRSLVPPDGDVHLRLQRLGPDTSHGPPSIHLDLHMRSVAEATTDALALGADLLDEILEPDAVEPFTVLRSPGGLVFCLVPEEGQQRRASPTGPGPHPVAVAQLAMDVPAALYDAEVAFWVGLTGFAGRVGVLDEFTVLVADRPLPYRLLLQRLGPDDPAESARLHLDLSAGAHNDDVAAVHERLGAVVVARHRFWTVMGDPNGMIYCLTRRHPSTGDLMP